METFKPSESTSSALRNCGNCVHCYPERLPNQLMMSLVCHRFPPQLITAPVAPTPVSPIQIDRQPQPTGYQVIAMFPVVQPHQFCHCHDPKPSHPEASVSISDPDSSVKVVD